MRSSSLLATSLSSLISTLWYDVVLLLLVEIQANVDLLRNCLRNLKHGTALKKARSGRSLLYSPQVFTPMRRPPRMIQTPSYLPSPTTSFATRITGVMVFVNFNLIYKTAATTLNGCARLRMPDRSVSLVASTTSKSVNSSNFGAKSKRQLCVHLLERRHR